MKRKELPKELKVLQFNGFEKLEKEGTKHELSAATGILVATFIGLLFWLTVYYLLKGGF